jgi:REP element-mobilizing transposase RayT
MPKAWNDWYHVTVHTYGSWLRGDPRGWRDKDHRQHVDGDYRNPPPLKLYERLHNHAKSIMKREPVLIAKDVRQIVVESVVEKLKFLEIQVIVASVDANHLHLLARFPDHRPKVWIGIAKKHASHVLRQSNLRLEPGGIWARYCRAEPIVDRRHQVNTFRYINAHAARGAAVWRFDHSE